MALNAMLELRIAKPCDQSWTAMKGDERVRHCQQCRLDVYNISELTEKEVEDLIRRTEGKFCARLYRRTDNRVMTKDCPRGVVAIRRRFVLATGAAMAAVFVGGSVALRKKESVDSNTVVTTPTQTVVTPKYTTGVIATPIAEEGAPKPKVESAVLGRVSFRPAQAD